MNQVDILSTEIAIFSQERGNNLPEKVKNHKFIFPVAYLSDIFQPFEWTGPHNVGIQSKFNRVKVFKKKVVLWKHWTEKESSFYFLFLSKGSENSSKLMDHRKKELVVTCQSFEIYWKSNMLKVAFDN